MKILFTPRTGKNTCARGILIRKERRKEFSVEINFRTYSFIQNFVLINNTIDGESRGKMGPKFS